MNRVKKLTVPRRYTVSLSFIIIFLLFSMGKVSAQTKILDSLRISLDTEMLADTSRILLLNELAYEYRYVNADSTNRIAKKAHRLSQQTNFSKGICKSLSNLAIFHHVRGQFDSALYFYSSALPIAKEQSDLKQQSSLENNIGLIHWNMGNYPRALAHLQKALSIDQTLNDETGQAATLNNIGLLYNNIGNSEKAMEYYKRSLQVFLDLKNEFRLAQLYNNMALLEFNSGNYAIAYDYYQRSIDYTTSSKVICHQANPLVGIGKIMMEENELDSVIFYGERVVEISKHCQDSKILAVAYLLMGKARRHKGEIRKAEKLLKEGYRLSLVSGAKENLKTAAHELYGLYKEMGRYSAALDFHELYVSVQDSLLNEEKIRALTHQEMEYEADMERNRLLNEQEKERLVLERQINREKEIKNYFLLGFMILLLLTISYYRSYLRKKKTSLLLEKKNRTIHEINQSLVKLNKFKESLTHMIAHDLKNSLNAILNLTKGRVDKRKVQVVSQSGHYALNLVTNMLDVQKFEEAAINLEIRPHHLSDISDEAFRQVEFLLSMKNIDLSYNVSDCIISVDKGVLIRVLVNLLTNAIRYSDHKGEIDFHVFYRPGPRRTICISVTNYGKGIEQKYLTYIFDKYWCGEKESGDYSPSTGLGLTFCKLAIEAHSGKIEVESNPVMGTTFTICIPEAECVPESHKVQIQKLVSGIEKPVLSLQEQQVVSNIFDKNAGIKVFHVSRLNKIIKELEESHINPVWLEELKTSIYHSDEVAFIEMIRSCRKSEKLK